MDVRADIENGIQAIYQKMENRHEISSTLGITEDDYFTLDKLVQCIEKSQALKNIQAEALTLQADLSNITLAIEQRIVPLLQRIADTAVEMDIEREYPNNLIAKLMNFLLAEKFPLGQELSFDNLFISINTNLSDKTFREAFQNLLLEPVSDRDDAPLIGTYIQLNDKTIVQPGYIRNAIKHKYSAEFTEKGIELSQASQLVAAHTEELHQLEKIHQDELARLKVIEDAWAENEAQFEKNKQQIREYFSRSKDLTKGLIIEINEIAKNVNGANLQSAVISEASCEILEAYVIVSQKKLAYIKKAYDKATQKYGNAPAWVEINNKIAEAEKNVEFLVELAKNQRVSLEFLAKQKKIQPDAMQVEPEVAVVAQPEKPVTLISSQPNDDKDAVKRYYDKTCLYSQDLSESMKKNLIDLKKTPLWNSFKLPDSIDLALNDLKELYDMKNDKNNDSIERRKMIGDNLAAAKFVDLKEGLEKYNVIITKVLNALGNPDHEENYAGRRANFMGVLRHPDTQLLISKHRNNGRFINFVRDCGINFFSVFGKRSYGVKLFSPRSARYSQDIEQEEQARYAKRPKLN